MKRLVGVFGLFVIASLMFASGATAGPSSTSDTQVTIAGWRFHPKDLQVTAGTTVVWLNTQKGHHTSISDPGDGVTWNSKAIPPGGTFSFTFTTPGTYPYHCRYGHGIHGVIEVLPASP